MSDWRVRVQETLAAIEDTVLENGINRPLTWAMEHYYDRPLSIEIKTETNISSLHPDFQSVLSGTASAYSLAGTITPQDTDKEVTSAYGRFFHSYQGKDRTSQAYFIYPLSSEIWGSASPNGQHETEVGFIALCNPSSIALEIWGNHATVQISLEALKKNPGLRSLNIMYQDMCNGTTAQSWIDWMKTQ